MSMNDSPGHSRRALLRATAALGLGGCAGMVGAAVGGAVTSATSDPLRRTAVIAPRALGALLLDVTLAGERLVAVGERGTVLLSDDAGASWRQVSCPVSVTLTAVQFTSPRLGWVVGHAGVVLHSADAGASWTLQLDGQRAAQLALDAAQRDGDAALTQRAKQLVKDGADKPLLAMHFDADAKRGLVIGAYGLAFATDDGGTTWRSWMDRIDNHKGLHLNAVHVAGGTAYLAGEQGLLLRADGFGAPDDVRFKRLSSPYEGSWFALIGINDKPSNGQMQEVLVAAGLRGNAWWSTDRGASFQQSVVPVPISFSAAARTREGELLLLNQAGMLLSSSNRGRSFSSRPLPPGPLATGLAQLADGSFVASTMGGPTRWPRLVSAQAVNSTTATYAATPVSC